MNRKKTTTPLLIVLCIFMFLAACSKKEESPEPPQTQNNTNNNNGNNGNNGNNNNPTAKDTAKLFQDKSWVTKKYIKNGDENAAPFMIGTSWRMNAGGSYSFNIPNFPPAGGTWKFSSSGKSTVNFTTQANTHFDWKIISIDENKLVTEEQQGANLIRYEFEY